MRTGVHAVHHYKAQFVHFKRVADVGRHLRGCGAPSLQYVPHPVASVMIARQGIHGNAQGRQRVIKDMVGVEVAAVGQVAAEHDNIRLLSHGFQVRGGGIKTAARIHNPEGQAVVAA